MNELQAVILYAAAGDQAGAEAVVVVGVQVGVQAGVPTMILLHHIQVRSPGPMSRQGGGQGSGVDLRVVLQLVIWLEVGEPTTNVEGAADSAATTPRLRAQVPSLRVLDIKAQVSVPQPEDSMGAKWKNNFSL